MNHILLAAAVLATATMTLAAPAQAANAPWCAVINQGRDAYWDCQYQSFAQCQPTVLAGNRGFCNENPAYVAPVRASRRAARRRVRHD
ncbi:MAG TPA: DUF3551 domain-containing protein [Pseudolabrys sp.]|nr:DUF3551 domain-containing protein [Pseudolabrys sp.]